MLQTEVNRTPLLFSDHARDELAEDLALHAPIVYCRLDNIRDNDYNDSMKANLRTEIQQRKPFAGLEQEVFLSLQLTAHRLLDPWVLFLKQEGLTPAQYNMLRILRGTYPHGFTCTEISERLIHRDPDITRMTDRLETQKLVRRERAVKDRRVVRVLITEEGLARLKQLDGPVRSMPRRMLGKLGKRQLLQLLKLLAGVREVSSRLDKHELK
jgi:DNA-binding MarR family transcriptional regulator